MKQLSARIEDDKAKALRIRVLQYDTSVQEIIEKAIDEWLEANPPK